MSQSATPHSGTALAKGAQLSYEVAGEGPALVLIHAGIADSRTWDAQFDGAVELEIKLWVDGPRRSPESVAPAIRERVFRMDRDNFVAQEESEGRPRRLDPPAIGRLRTIAAPTLVVVGDEDVPDVLDTADLLATGSPGARKVVVHGAAHMLTMERPADFKRLVLDFLSAPGR